jgi:hypothetical protein
MVLTAILSEMQVWLNETYIRKTGYNKEDSVLDADEVYLNESHDLFSEISRKLVEYFDKTFK